MPKSAFKRSYQASSPSAPQATHSSSLIALRHWRNGIASGPTGCRSCQVPLSTISSTFSPTTDGGTGFFRAAERSEEHTSELQSQSNLVCRLLLERNK